MDIIQYLYKTVKENLSKNNGLISGRMGELLFLAHYDKINDGNSDVLQFVDDEKMIGSTDSMNYSNGICGILSGLKVLESLKLGYTFDFDLSSFDELITKDINKCLTNKNYDFIYGALGLVLYQLLTERTSELLLNSLRAIDKQKESIDTEFFFTSYNRRTFETNYCDLGLSHGMAAMIFVLGKLSLVPAADNLVSNLLIGLYKFYRGAENTNEISIFPFGLSQQNKFPKSRLAWCYGDPGIGISFLQAGIHSNLEVLMEYGIEILEHAQKRKHLMENMVYDPYFCHGTVGLSMIFLNAFKITGVKSFKSASDFWFNKTYKFLKQNNMDKPPTNLLEGLSGIGLSFLSYSSTDNLPWESLLLIN